jgi:predicted DNA-binding transcriptional regulator AlpA
MTLEQEEKLDKSLSNQEEIIGRQRIIQRLLNQIVPKPVRYSKAAPADLITAKEAAMHLGMSETQFYVRLNKDEFPIHFLDGEAGRRVSRADLDNWITARPKKQNA